ncbi:MAG: hypothetical protein V3S55_05105, partial [Nitrospiraceae bacterium]
LAPFILGKLIPWLGRFTVSSRTVIKTGFLMVIIGNAIWMTPHAFVATQALAPEDGSLSLPSYDLFRVTAETTIAWADLALMPAKNAAAFTLVFVTIVNYILYNRAIRQGTIVWGKIDFASQFVLIFLAFSAIWTMGLMGAVRSLVRKYFHVYNLLPDFTAESFTPTLAYSAWWITAITLVFFAVVSFAILLTLRTSEAKAQAPEGGTVPAGAS